MQFSVQQLQGGALYGPKTRVGNWYEDVVLQEERYAEFRQRKEGGKLAIGFRSRRFNICCQKVPHSFSSDGKLRFGDTVTVINENLKATLADDPFEEMQPQTARYMVTATPANVGATARSTFVITRVPASLQDTLPNKYADEGVLHYGQPFQLTANPSIRVDDANGILQPALYLASQLKTDRACSKWSNRQPVYLTEKVDYNTVWTMHQPAHGKYDGVKRQFSEYEPVPANAELVIIHKATNKPLAVDKKYGELTDFGGEYEVTAHSFTTLGKNELALAEARGMATAGTITKPEQPENIWTVQTAKESSAAKDDRVLPPLATPSTILAVVKARMRESGRGVSAVRAKIPRTLPKVDVADVKWVLRELELGVDDHYLGLWLNSMDTRRNGMVLVADIVSALRGDDRWSDARAAVVADVWATIQGQQGPACPPIPAAQALKRLNPAVHPKAVAKLQVPEGLAAEFKTVACSAVKGPHRSEDVIPLEDFLDYHKDLSSELEDDASFVAVVKGLWGLRA